MYIPLYSAHHATRFHWGTAQRIASIQRRPHFGASRNLFSEDSVTRQKTYCKGKLYISSLAVISGQTEARTCRGKIMNVVKYVLPCEAWNVPLYHVTDENSLRRDNILLVEAILKFDFQILALLY